MIARGEKKYQIKEYLESKQITICLNGCRKKTKHSKKSYLNKKNKNSYRNVEKCAEKRVQEKIRINNNRQK